MIDVAPIDPTYESSIALPTARATGAHFEIRERLATTGGVVAYDGFDQRTKRIVDIYHFSAQSLGEDRFSELRRRVRLSSLVDSDTLRRVVEYNFDGDRPQVVMQASCRETLRTLLEADAIDANRLLELLKQTGTALLVAQRFGLTHGQLAEPAIGWSGTAPQLDFTGLPNVRTDSGKARRIAQSQHDDAGDFAAVIRRCLRIDAVLQQCRHHSSRVAAKLQQLVAVNTPDTQSTELDEIVRCLGELLATGLVESSADEHDGTLELLPVVAVSNSPLEIDRTADSPKLNPRLPADSTSELTGDLAVAENAIFANSTSRRELTIGGQLGRYRILSKLGQGGMGAVFKGVDLADDSVVAIKVLSQAALSNKNALRRFQKEARLLASIRSPHITNLIEVNEEEGLHFIVLEFVDGVDLKKWLATQGPLAETDALMIASQLSAALLDAHQREIVHRDIKPENILLEISDEVSSDGRPVFRTRLTDFGIARSIDQSESLAMTQAGGLLGTPLYMAPEQFKGAGNVIPQSDIYSIGVTLYQLLTGHTPFAGNDAMELAGKHCFEAAPKLAKWNAKVSEPVEQLVAKCLAKNPSDRFADAGQLLAQIERLKRGDTRSSTLRPVIPAHDVASVIVKTYTWNLRAGAAELWPFVTNTERLNRAIGLPPVEYTTTHDAGVMRRFAKVKLAGMSLEWEEHPFEWVEGRRMSIFRDFGSGPFDWFVSTVELQSQPEGGTRLVHTIRILPRHMIGRVVAKLETGRKCQRALDKVYTRIDQTITSGPRLGLTDPFEQPSALKTAPRERLAQRIAALIEAGVDANLAEVLEQFLATASPQELEKLRPRQLAKRLDLDDSSLVEACLLATNVGLLAMQWDVICPTCRVAASTENSLRLIESHAHCEACDYDFDSDKANAIELVFRVAADIRPTSVGKYCIGGPWHAPHVVAQLRLEPNESLQVDLQLEAGDYVLRGPNLAQSISIRVRTTNAPSRATIDIGGHVKPSRVEVLRAGTQVIELKNQQSLQHIVRIERTLNRDDVVTAAQASTLPRFRELFPGEIFDAGRIMNADSITFLATSCPNVDDLYTTMGDAATYEFVQEWNRENERIVVEHGGDIVKVVGEAVLASFASAADAARAAFTIVAAAKTPAAGPLKVTVGVHCGKVMVTTANGRLDYFGATTRQATALPTLVGAGVALTESVLADPEIDTILAEFAAKGQTKTITLPGGTSQIIQFFETLS